MKKVGIVIINFNSINYLKITLKSILEAKTNIAYMIGIIDNGSARQDRIECKDFIEKMQLSHVASTLKFYDAGKNLGFSGGNNVVIKDFLLNEDITHICLLNSDVIVTDYWLDYLLEKDKDIIGPVTNAAGNEQTIQIDYEVNATEDAIPIVNEYAFKRHICFQGYVVNSDLVTFFATIFKREVFEKIGLLDEQFYPGSYEDDDYCFRALNANYNIAISRDCFLHHFGSGSFSKLNMNDRKYIGNINRERFEKKWNTKWQERTWKLLESCKQDIDFLLIRGNQEWACKQLDSSFKEMEALIAEWGEAIRFFTSQNESTKAPVCTYSAKQLVDMLWAKVKRKVFSLNKKAKQSVINKIHYKENQKKEKAGIEKIYHLLDKAKANGHKAICVFAPMYNKENEKDGYVQRIKAIDTTALNNMCRIYLYDEGTDCSVMRFDFIDALHGYIVFNSHDAENLNEIMKLVKYCGATYTHSILRFMEDRSSKQLWNIFELENVKHFWDMHGTVPEEYELSESPLGCQLANNIEKLMADKVDVVVVVTYAMGKYVKEKYPSMKAKIVVVPIFTRELLEIPKCEKKLNNKKFSVVYAGGMQPWQNVNLMQDIIQSTQNTYNYMIFVPNLEEFWNLWGERSHDINIRVESKAPHELYEEYESCDFGFVLRDSSPVNYVACPTKIIEYLKYGIIPILKSTEIGDFVDLGMEYITYTDLMKGLTISHKKRNMMQEKNYEILDKLVQTSKTGLNNLENLLEV
jgi:GT2 family glycosyltransferase|nr:glycosyltransferase [uncultured Acetatifactor sp.]